MDVRFVFVLLCAVCYTYAEEDIGHIIPIPEIGLGTWLGNNSAGRIKPYAKEVEDAVIWAAEAGYRLIDTAPVYKTEAQVGRGVKRVINGNIATRKEMFIVTKLWNDAHARDAVVPALRKSLEDLMMDYVDLYLIHWPVGQFANQSYDYTDYLETWRGMMEAKKLGLAKHIGLSNFNEAMIDRILNEKLEKPAALQVEINLNLQQPQLLEYCKNKQIAVMAYSPLGSLFPTHAKEDAPPPRVDDPELVEMARKREKTVPQIVLRYLSDLGVVPIPKSITKSRIVENFDIVDIELKEDELETLKNYDKGYRTIPQEKWKDHPYYPF